MSKRQNWTIILFFLLLVFGFTAASLFKPDTAFSEKENRELAQMPKLSLQDIANGKFSSDYETYLTDQFPLRNHWIGAKTRAERAIGKQEVNDIFFAGDGYLIETHRGSFQTENAVRNISYLADFVSRQADLLGAEHVKVMIAPNAVDILKDKLPPFADGKEENAYLDKVGAALLPGTFLDLQEVLSAHKDEYIYYRTDHHWTTLGAWYAYEAWAKSLGINTPAITDYEKTVLTEEFFGTIEAKVNVSVPGDTMEAWHLKNEVPYTVCFNHRELEAKTNLYEESYLDTRDKYAVFFGGNQPLTEIKAGAASGRRLLIIKDSYANCFVPFAIQNFDMISMVDMRYFNEHLSEYIAENDFTDILFLYNASGFAEDVSLAKLAL